MAIQAYRDEQGHFCLALNIAEGEEPPTEFEILAAGETKTTKGPLLFDKLAGDSVMTDFQDKGRDQLPVDYDHGMLSFITTPDGSKAAGWFTPSVSKSGSLMASDVQWTPKAAQALGDREYRFFSPAVMLDEESDPPRVMKLINLALTNLPATKNQAPLVASDKSDESPGKGTTIEDEMSSELLKLLGAKTEAEAMVMATEQFRTIAALFTALSVDGIQGIMPAVEKLKAQATTAVELADKLRAIETERATEKRDALIVELHDGGKLPESLHDWAKTMDYDSLKAFGDAAPKNPKYTAVGKPDDDVVTLSDAEREVAYHLNMTDKEFVEAKKAEADATKAHRAQYDRNARRAG
jgi:phage I-like protein